MKAEVVRTPKEQLRQFFRLRDSKYVDLVDDLFNYFEFNDIAHGIFDRYGCLPAPWQGELKLLQKSYPKSRHLDWLDMSKVVWLDESTAVYPRATKGIPFVVNKLSPVVDEFIENEYRYLKLLRLFMKLYVPEIIGRAKDGCKTLGLTLSEAEVIFGEKLQKVYESAEDFYFCLETLVIVPGKSKVDGGRVRCFVDICKRKLPEIVDAYADYSSQYQYAKALLNAQTQKSSFSDSKETNFVKTWRLVTNGKKELKGFGLDSLLISPIKRFPDYRLFIERLGKDFSAGNKNQRLSRDLRELKKEVTELISQIDQRVIAAQTEIIPLALQLPNN